MMGDSPRSTTARQITDVVGAIPYRMALAGGWIDQPLVSAHNPDPPGAMVVVSLTTEFRFMDRAGMATGTRKVANELWNGKLPQRPSAELVRELYQAENAGRADPSGSQDMIGLIYPGINRLDFDIRQHGGVFPSHIESNSNPQVARWLEQVVWVVPVAQRPEGYTPLDVKNLDRSWIARLGRSGKDCYAAILAKDLHGLGRSVNECMQCWETILPGTVRHHTLAVDLIGLLQFYQSRYAGAMYSGCGGGYLYVISEEPVPGAFKIKVRL